MNLAEQFPGNAIARDGDENIIVGSYTNAAGEATPGAYQTQYAPKICEQVPPHEYVPCNVSFVRKFNPSGQLLWATYLGPVDENGVTQSNTQFGTVNKLLVDSKGNVWVDAATCPPLTADAYQTTGGSACVAELSPDGKKLLYSTRANGHLLAIDSRDALYLSGPALNGGVLSAIKFDPSINQVVYSTPLPRASEPFSVQYGVVNSAGMFYIGWSGSSAGFEPVPGVYSHPSSGSDVGVIGIDPTGKVIFFTMIGGAGNDRLTGMTCDQEGNLYLAGIQWTGSFTSIVSPDRGPYLDFPVTPDAMNPTWNPAFLLRLPPDASSLLYATFLGRSNTEILIFPPLQPEDVKIGPDGKLRMIAVSDQDDIPLTPDSFQPCYPAYTVYSPQLAQSVHVPSRWTYLQFSPDLRAIEYATSIAGLTTLNREEQDSFGGPFYVDTSGNAYFATDLNRSPFFDVFNVAQKPPRGPTCLADYVLQTTTSAVPGLLASILGPGIGPSQPTPMALDSSGRVATQLAATQVLFDGIPAPILSAAPNRIDIVVPFGIATSGTTTISVLNDDALVGTLTVSVAAAAPFLFTNDGTGYGDAAWNQDGTPNSLDNPAHVGDILTFYGTGLGAMTPTVVDGTIPQLPQSATASAYSFDPVGGSPCTAVYSGDAPGSVEGIVQYNCRVKAGSSRSIFGSYSGTSQVSYSLYVTQ